jgi:glycosyltransferase involved in cell wall biosynthesis
VPMSKPPLRILFHNCRLLHPLNGGVRIRTYNMLRELRARHQITYLCLRTPADAPSATEQAAEYCHDVVAVDHPVKNRRSLWFYLEVLGNTLFGKYPFLASKYVSRAAVAQLQSLVNSANRRSFDLLICDYLAPMGNLLELGTRPRVPTLLFQHNVESMIFERHANTARNPAKAMIYRQQWRMTRALERQSAEFVDAQVAVSESDARHFREECGMANVLGAVPTGVDCNYFQAREAPPAKPVLAFLGAMDWDANLDAARWFATEILPKIRQSVPAAEFLVIGRNPPAQLRDLAASDPRIQITGTVPDVRPVMREAAAMVLPLRIGGGTRIKVYEAMAMGVPVISTRIGAEGLDVTHGENILLADTAGEFAQQAAGLVSDAAKAQRIAAAARARVAGKYSWSRVAEQFSDYCYEAVQRGERRLAPMPPG